MSSGPLLTAPVAPPRHLRDLRVSLSRRRALIKAFIRAHHSLLPDPPCAWRLGFILHDEAGNVWGVAIWALPSARLEDQVHTLELQRMTLTRPLPRNAATYMLGQMRREIRRHLPEITRLISYSDPAVHDGAMYRADNWTVTGERRRAPVVTHRPGRTHGTARTHLLKWERRP